MHRLASSRALSLQPAFPARYQRRDTHLVYRTRPKAADAAEVTALAERPKWSEAGTPAADRAVLMRCRQQFLALIALRAETVAGRAVELVYVLRADRDRLS